MGESNDINHTEPRTASTPAPPFDSNLNRLTHLVNPRSNITPDAGPFDNKPSADPGAALAILRTELALDRTQLAWVRTAFTFITAGFALDKVTEVIHQTRVLEGKNWVENSHVTGMILVGAATLFLLLCSVAYIRQIRRLAQLKSPPVTHFPTTLAPTALVVILGVALFVLILTT